MLTYQYKIISYIEDVELNIYIHDFTSVAISYSPLN